MLALWDGEVTLKQQAGSDVSVLELRPWLGWRQVVGISGYRQRMDFYAVRRADFDIAILAVLFRLGRGSLARLALGLDHFGREHIDDATDIYVDPARRIGLPPTGPTLKVKADGPDPVAVGMSVTRHPAQIPTSGITA